MPTIQEIQQRKNDCTAQTFCDKRTLATLLNFFSQNNRPPVSLSELIRISLEYLEVHIIADSPTCEVFATEDADQMLKQQFRANLNPMRKLKLGGIKRPRYDYSTRRMISEEEAYVSGEESLYGRTTSQKIIDRAKEDAEKRVLKPGTPEFDAAFQKGLELAGMKQPENREFRPNPDAVSSDEPSSLKTQRWNEELQAEKAALGCVPADIISAHINEPTNTIIEEEDNEDEQEEN